MSCLIDKYIIINDHFKRDLRRIGGGHGGAPGFYQRAVTSTVYKNYNAKKCDESKYENDHYTAPTTNGGVHSNNKTVIASSCNTYQKSVRNTITKRSNYMPRVHVMESDQWNPNSAPRPLVTKTNNTYNYANTNKIMKKYNQVQPIGHENDQWHPKLPDLEQQKYNENVGKYYKHLNATIKKPYNQLQPIQYESDQWHSNTTINNNINKQYQNFENKKQEKPWHAISVQQEEENKLSNKKMDDLLQRTVLSLENIEIQMTVNNTGETGGVGQGKEWLQNVPRERRSNNNNNNNNNDIKNNFNRGKTNTKKYVIKGKQNSPMTENKDKTNQMMMSH